MHVSSRVSACSNTAPYQWLAQFYWYPDDSIFVESYIAKVTASRPEIQSHVDIMVDRLNLILQAVSDKRDANLVKLNATKTLWPGCSKRRKGSSNCLPLYEFYRSRYTTILNFLALSHLIDSLKIQFHAFRYMVEIPNARTIRFETIFFIRTAIDWNSLPASVSLSHYEFPPSFSPNCRDIACLVF